MRTSAQRRSGPLGLYVRTACLSLHASNLRRSHWPRGIKMDAKNDAINERSRASRPNADLAFLLQSSFGLDHYGGSKYLSKLGEEDLVRLSTLLQASLAAVDKERLLRAGQPALTKARALSLNSPDEGDVASVLLPFMNQPLVTALTAVSGVPFSSAIPSTLIGAVMRHVNEEADGVFSFELMKPDLCDRLLAACSALTKDADAVRERLTAASTRAQVPLHHLGAGDADAGTGPYTERSLSGPLLEAFMRERVLAPLSRILYPSFASDVNFSYGYVIGYAADGKGAGGHDRPTALLERTGLRPHTDDSEVTLNVNLGVEGFEGGELLVHRLRDPKTGSVRDPRGETTVIPVKKGRAIIHAGQHGHEVLPVTKGEWYALILWGRDSSFRSKTCPCCLVHRRNASESGSPAVGGGRSGTSSCICDETFN